MKLLYKKQRTRKSIAIKFIIFTSILLAIILSGFFAWYLKPCKSLNVWILDKTVPQKSYREHRSLFWILNHLKVVKDDKSKYDFGKDYFGFFPNNQNSFRIKDFSNSKEVLYSMPDLIYLADTYGVFRSDLTLESKLDKKSEIVYGGLSEDDLTIIKSNLKDGRVIIGEFNTIQSPTSEKVRKEIEKIFGFKWTGWYGRYFQNLTKGYEVPDWIVDLYESVYKRKWNFKNSGVVLLNEDGKILVFEKGKDFKKKPVVINFDSNYEKIFGAQSNIGFYYWFEVLEPAGAEVVAKYSFNFTKDAQNVLKKFSIPSNFPAVLIYKNDNYTSYYFAGDFADVGNFSSLYNYLFIDRIRKYITFESEGSQAAFFWKVYFPMMKTIIAQVTKKPVKLEDAKLYNHEGQLLVSKIENKKFVIFNNKNWQKFFVKGVNLGLALPGKYFTQMPEDMLTYYNWFEKIADMRANVVRLYTLAPPAFYSALKLFNVKNPEKRLYLIQEIWPEENPEDKNYLEANYSKEFEDEIKNVIDAVHGKANIPQRKGRAWGRYTQDVSMYTLAYLIGRELEPDEVLETDMKNKGYTYKGEYFYTTKTATPTESWLARMCDFTLSYESQKYKMQHPVGIVSWPTLDPVVHSSEWNKENRKDLEYNDKAQINIDNIEIGKKNKAGFFGAYHIYPNYPDFMNNQEEYKAYKDDKGRLMYGGYLKELKEATRKHPLLVAEVGLSTSLGIAHYNPDGYHHGGIPETEQGKGLVRMIEAIKKEGYLGAMIFEWMDEWAKKTWITEPFMIPYDRHIYWHNVVDPEQNYGILANESLPPENFVEYKDSGLVKSVKLSHNQAYFYIVLEFSRQLKESESVIVGIDTFGEKIGDFKFSKDLNIYSPVGLEFVVKYDQNSVKVLAHPDYNIGKGKFLPKATQNGVFEDIVLEVNKERVTQDGKLIKPIYHNFSILRKGKFDEPANTWYLQDNKLFIRIPWMLLNFSDPSSKTVLSDSKRYNIIERDMLKTTKTDGITVVGVVCDKTSVIDIFPGASEFSTRKYTWKDWEQPVYKERLKKSYNIIKEYFLKLD